MRFLEARAISTPFVDVADAALAFADTSFLIDIVVPIFTVAPLYDGWEDQ